MNPFDNATRVAIWRACAALRCARPDGRAAPRLAPTRRLTHAGAFATGFDPASERGFTLLEVIVALVIAGLALAVLFQGGIGGLRTARIAGSYQVALSRAQSRLTAAGLPDAIKPLDQQGDDGAGYHWHTRIVALGSATVRPPAVLGVTQRNAAASVSLYALSVVVSWQGDGGSREVRLVTDRLGPAAGARGP